MNPLSAPMPSAIMPMMTGPTPTTGVFQHLLNLSATLADAPPNVSVDVVTPATAPICAPAITLALPPLAEVQNWAATEMLPPATVPEAHQPTATIVLPQPTAPEAQNRAMTIALPQTTAPENRIEDAGTVAAEKAEASSSPIDPALVPPSTVQMPPRVSTPVDAPAPPIASQATTPSVADAARVPAPPVRIAPQARAAVPIAVTPLAPQVRKLTNTAETRKPLDATPAQTLAQWLPSAPQEPVKRADAMPTVRPDTLPVPLLTQENKPQLPGPLPAHNLGLVDDQLFSFEPQSSIRAAQASVAPTVAPTAPPTDTPIAELRQLVITADGEWIGALARDIVGHAASDNQLAFTLIPEHLGQLDVAVTTDNGKVDIRLETSTHAAAQAISAEQARLIEDLRHAGLKLGQFDMSNRQNGNGQQQAPRPDSQHTANNSTPAQAKASSQAQGRFA
jgi:flagellar hook-length control protein FliK